MRKLPILFLLFSLLFAGYQSHAQSALYLVTGGGSYCAGDAGVDVGLSGSDPGSTYLLYNGATIMGTLPGTGGALDFGLQTVAGTYNVVADPYGTYPTTMTGSAAVVVNPLPVAYAVSGGGSYCSGDAGVHVFLNSSAIGVNYQVYYGSNPLGAPVAGTGGGLDFGYQTLGGAYTVIATDAASYCSSSMTGSATVSILPLPAAFAVAGGGGYCVGGAGVDVSLGNSSSTDNYQLFFNSAPIGTPVTGTGASLDFGMQTAAGIYTVAATDVSTSCVNNMTGNAVVTINSQPGVFTVTGGGSYCSGDAGVDVAINGSELGVNYELLNGSTAVGVAIAGTGVLLDFGLQTSAGTYTVVATNAATGCMSNMNGSAMVTINPLPNVYSVTGGGTYCLGDAGADVGLSGSDAGVTYLLYNGSSVTGGASGSGGAVDFGLHLGSGTYTATGTDATTGCTAAMAGSTSILVKTRPVAYNITGGGAYCVGGAGVDIALDGSTSGINYQLLNGGLPVGSVVAGSGSALDFGVQPAAGSYSVTASDASTGCSSGMNGSAAITINPLPAMFNVTGGGGYCAGSAGAAIGLNGSVPGVSYQLYLGASATGSPIAGTGLLLDFGLQTSAGTYSVMATDATTGCTNLMPGSPVVNANPLPATYNVTGGGNYCATGPGISVGLDNSDIGINYQLYFGGVPTGSLLAGTGTILDFGPQTAAGTYAVAALDATSGCSVNMSGTAVITAVGAPVPYSVTGGGSYCAGSAGVHIGLPGSDVGVMYQLFNGGAAAGTPIPGTGGAVDFGLQSAAGLYTVIAADPATGCTGAMPGSTTVSVNALPATFPVTGGGNYCPGGAGVSVGQSGSETGVTYQLYNGFSMVGSAVPGTGYALDMGLQTATGTYTIVATNAASGCTNNLAGSATVGINPLPTAYNLTGGGSYCPAGTGVHVGLSGSDPGVPYQLYMG